MAKNGFEVKNVEGTYWYYQECPGGVEIRNPFNGDESETDYYGGHLKVPKEIDGKRVVGLGLGAFASCWGIKSLELPEGLEYLAHHSLLSCLIDKLVLPSTVKRVEVTAFELCRNLKYVTVSKGNIYYEGLSEGLREISTGKIIWSPV